MKYSFKINGKKVSRAQFLKKKRKGRAGIPMTNLAWTKPLSCEAMGVQPSQIEEFRKFDREAGLGDTEYDKHGNPVFYSRKAYNDYKRAHGYCDRNAGFGDVAPRNWK